MPDCNNHGNCFNGEWQCSRGYTGNACQQGENIFGDEDDDYEDCDADDVDDDADDDNVFLATNSKIRK